MKDDRVCIRLCLFLSDCPNRVRESDRGQRRSNKTLSVTLFICRGDTKRLSQMLCSFLESGRTSVGLHRPRTTGQESCKHSPELFTAALSGGIKGTSEAGNLTQSGIQIGHRGPLSLSPIETRFHFVFHSLCVCPSQRRARGLKVKVRHCQVRD